MADSQDVFVRIKCVSVFYSSRYRCRLLMCQHTRSNYSSKIGKKEPLCWPSIFPPCEHCSSFIGLLSIHRMQYSPASLLFPFSFFLALTPHRSLLTLFIATGKALRITYPCPQGKESNRREREPPKSKAEGLCRSSSLVCQTHLCTIDASADPQEQQQTDANPSIQISRFLLYL